MEPESLLPLLQEPAICLNLEPDESSPQSPILFKSHCNIIHLRPRLPSGLFFSGFPTKTLYSFHYFPHTCYMARPSRTPRFDHRCIWWGIQIMDWGTTKWSRIFGFLFEIRTTCLATPACSALMFCYFLSLSLSVFRVRCFLQSPLFSQTVSVVFRLGEVQLSHPYQAATKTAKLYIYMMMIMIIIIIIIIIIHSRSLTVRLAHYFPFIHESFKKVSWSSCSYSGICLDSL
jgi:hypothetical protein